jgi:hypothetical protein
MNLLSIGDTTINIDRVNGVQDNQVSEHGDGAFGQRVLRILFDEGTIELADADAQAFRRWLRHNSRNLAARKDADGQVLLSPEEQLLRVTESLVDLLDQASFVQGPRNQDQTSTTRRLAHRLASLIDGYITGQLKPEPARMFDRLVD